MSKLCPDFVQYLSKFCPCPIWTNIGQIFKILLGTMSIPLFKTKVGQKLDMDKILTKFRQTILLLDPNILWTKLGQNVDIFLSKFCQIYKNLGQSNSLQTNLGQLTKILDKILTKIRQNLVKLRLFWQLLDIDKTWTKVWQKIDKTLTFVQKLSKFCHTTNSSGAPMNFLVCAIRSVFLSL